MAELSSQDSRSMSECITEFLGANQGRGFCDDCIESQLRPTPPKKLHELTNTLALTDFYKRDLRHCHGCGLEKQVIYAA